MMSDQKKAKRPIKTQPEIRDAQRAKLLYILNNPKHCSECLNRFGYMMCQKSRPDESIREDVKLVTRKEG